MTCIYLYPMFDSLSDKIQASCKFTTCSVHRK